MNKFKSPKTGIDLPYAKNIIGSFWQPKAVFINVNFVKTLDKKQFMSGIGEVLKYAYIEKNCNLDKELFLFEYLTLCCDKFLQKDIVTLIMNNLNRRELQLIMLLLTFLKKLSLFQMNKDTMVKNGILEKIMPFLIPY